MNYIPIIGLEIHCELKTESKMFCACPNNPESEIPNSNVCPVCMGHPGTLPVASAEAIRKVRMVGLALHSDIQENSKFDRKNYFYPDLPKGYQISQYDQPLCSGGYLEINDGVSTKKINVTRVHMEEDTAKLMHPEDEDYSLVNFNRSGLPLMELVTDPDIENSFQAREFVEELQLILRYLGASDADMEKGKMRVEVNISLGQLDANGKKQLGTKVEVKNLNSLKAVEGSVAYEIGRQTELLKKGEKIAQETRGWDDARYSTFSQREKEEAFDYRYFPEPDIPPMVIGADEIKRLRELVGELPAQKRSRFAVEYGLNAPTAEIFVANRELSNYFESAMSELEEWVNVEEHDVDNTRIESISMASICANYLTTDVQGILKGGAFCETTFPATPENFAEFIKLIYKKEISSKIAKAVLSEMAQNGGDPTEIISKKGLSQIHDEKQIILAVDDILAKNQKAVDDYKKGKSNAFQFLVGQVLAATKGRANPDMLKQILLDRLSRVE
ncbi:MAG: Asp-tRNA(Asn)/Glu-tRNA(Gln) amidotransferase subunit GatB [Candidatus Paceibacterota bacterium]